MEERPMNILKIPFKDRTEEEHRKIMSWFYNNSVRKYLVSAGEFKDDKEKINLKWEYSFPDNYKTFITKDELNSLIKKVTDNMRFRTK